MAKQPMKRENKVAGVGIGVAAAALAIAGGYVLWGKMGKQQQKKVKTWVAKARKDAIQNLAKARGAGEAQYKRIVDAAVKRYGLSEGISKVDLAKVASDLKGEWRNIQGHAKAIAKQLQKQRGGKGTVKKASSAKAKPRKRAGKGTTKKRITGKKKVV